jgi:geranylgeranylglycerol-phosphate geranylgeranyltransferase
MQKINLNAYFKIIRPTNSIMVGAAVIIGVILTSLQAVLTWKTLFGFLTGFFVASFSMVVNDIYDVEVDRVNRLNRPLVRGEIKISVAWAYSITLLFLGIVFSLLTSLTGFIIAVVFGFISWFYNFYLKKQGIIGNLTVALSTVIPYIYGSVVSAAVVPTIQGTFFPGSSSLLFWAVIVSFLAVTGREVIKTISDAEGDRTRRVKSITHSIGEENSARAGATLFILAVFSTFGPYLLKQAGIFYLVMVMIPDTLFVYLSFSILRDYSSANVHRVKKFALIGMLLGFIAFIAEKMVIR